MTSYTYKAYGLNFASTFPLPELSERKNGAADISVSLGKVPNTLPFPSDNGIAWQSEPGKLLLNVSDVGNYLILGNHQIVIEPFPGSKEDDVRIFLLGSVLGALLHARKMLVLHSSVIQTKLGAVLFMGSSGAGKSTLLGAFLKRGYAMMADDKAGIVVNENGVAEVMPGFPYARLTKETVDELRIPTRDLKFNRNLGKYVVPVERFGDEPCRIHAAYALNTHNRTDLSFEPLDTLDGFQALNRQTYRRRFLHNAEKRQAHFQTLSVLSKQARVTRVLRPDDARTIDELADRIEEDFSR